MQGKPWLKLKLAHRITAPFVAVQILLIAAGTMSMGYWVAASVEEQTWESLGDASAMLEHGLADEEDRLMVWARSVAGNDTMVAAAERRDAGTLAQGLLPLRVASGLDFVKVVDLRGNTVFESYSEALAVSRLNDRRASALAASGVLLPDIALAEDGPAAVLIAVAPLKTAQGIVGGVLVGRAMDTGVLRSWFPAGNQMQVAVIGPKGVYAATLDTGRMEPPAIPKGGAGRLHWKFLDREFLTVVSPLLAHGAPTGLSLAVLADKRQLDDLQAGLWLRLAAVMVVAAFITTVIGIAVSKGVSAPILALAGVARAFSRGDMSVRAAEEGADEIGELGRGFNSMVESLEASSLKIDRAYAELQLNHESLAEAHQQLAGLLEASTSVSCTLQVQPLLEEAGRHLLSLAGADSVWLLTVDRASGQMSGQTFLSRSMATNSPLLAAFGAKDERHSMPLDVLGSAFSNSVREGNPFFCDDLNSSERPFVHAVLDTDGDALAAIGSLAMVPFRADDQVLAVALVAGKDRKGFSSERQDIIKTFASTAALALRNASLFAEMERSGVTDALTQVSNHRAIHESLGEEIERSKRSGRPVSMMMIDVNNFKLFNDTFGHLTGDRVLHKAAATFKAACRSTDRVGRYGGDEFLIVLPETDTALAQQIGRRILSHLDADAIDVGNNELIPISCSIGLATYPADAATLPELIEKADAAMYRAKRSSATHVSSADEKTPENEDVYFVPSYGMLEALVTAVDNKDDYTRQHSDEVTRLALMLAEELSLSDEDAQMLRPAALLHDLGKLGVPGRILRKPGALTPDEQRVMRQHPSIGVLLAGGTPLPEVVKSAIMHHHERYDGNGYPQGLKGDQIPVLARLLAVVDSFTAMTADRPYRKRLSMPEAIAELRANVGSQFDPAIVEAFLRVLAAADGPDTEPALASAEVL